MNERSLHDLLVGWFDYYAERSTERLAGLTDDEYLWEPVAEPAPDAPPVSTIAWRLVHVCQCLAEHGLRAVAFEGGKADHHPPSEVPTTAAAAMSLWDRSIATWKHDIATVSEGRIWEPLGSEAGPFAADTVGSFIEHIHDEFIHHSAEIALLRDLYRAHGRAT